jgi:hypothetical protein
MVSRRVTAGVARLPKRSSARLSSANRPPPAPSLNLFLAALPSDDYERIAPTSNFPLKLRKSFTSRAKHSARVFRGGFFSI